MDAGTKKRLSGAMMSVGIGTAVAFGAIATGLVLSRRGRHIVRDAWRSRLRPPLEHRVLDALWSDPVMGRRRVDVKETAAGKIHLTGTVASEEEVERARKIVLRVHGVESVDAHLDVPASEPGGDVG